VGQSIKRDLRAPVDKPLRATRVVVVVAAAFMILSGCTKTDSTEDPDSTVAVTEALTTVPTAAGTVPSTTARLDPAYLVWVRIPHDEGVFGRGRGMESVAVWEGGLVAVGWANSGDDRDAAVWTSSNGVTWSRVLGNEGVFGGPGSREMESVAAWEGGLVAVGWDLSDGDNVQSGAVWTSSDGVTWSRVLGDEGVFGDPNSQWMESVAAWEGGLVAVGWELSGNSPDTAEVDGAVWISSNGVTWSRVPDDEGVFGQMNSVAVWEGGLVAVGAELSRNTTNTAEVDVNGAVWTSSNGVTWSRVPDDEGVFGGPDSQGMESVAVWEGGLVAVGWDDSGDDRDAAVWTSSDGVAWSRVVGDEGVFGGPDSQRIVGVAAREAGLVAVGWDDSGDDRDAAVWTSSDGVSWSRVPDDEGVFGGPGSQTMAGVAVWEGGLVAVGLIDSGGDRDAAVWLASDPPSEDAPLAATSPPSTSAPTSSGVVLNRRATGFGTAVVEGVSYTFELYACGAMLTSDDVDYPDDVDFAEASDGFAFYVEPGGDSERLYAAGVGVQEDGSSFSILLDPSFGPRGADSRLQVALLSGDPSSSWSHRLFGPGGNVEFDRGRITHTEDDLPFVDTLGRRLPPVSFEATCETYGGTRGNEQELLFEVAGIPWPDVGQGVFVLDDERYAFDPSLCLVDPLVGNDAAIEAENERYALRVNFQRDVILTVSLKLRDPYRSLGFFSVDGMPLVLEGLRLYTPAPIELDGGATFSLDVTCLEAKICPAEWGGVGWCPGAGGEVIAAQR